MVFSSMTFLWVFLPIVSALYFISDKKYKNIILLIASLIFYSWGEPKYIILMLISIVMNYILGLAMNKYKEKKRLVLVIAIILNIGLLGYFKYFNFFISTINNISGVNLFLRNIALPVGISFYTFQILSYIIDLYREEIEVQKNILNLALYISFFPQLIAGPIVKYRDVEKEINERSSSVDDIYYGLKRFIYGLSKKVLISNCLASMVDAIYMADINSINTPLMWLTAISYTLQIYFDFSGYSDMAIGLGRIFGFHFQENFNLPYISKSITEFWRRWHISLSTWFKEYIYIPLGGNRKGKFRTYLNLFIVFLITGLWHGASWNFVAWGIYYGIFLIIERLFLKKMLDKSKVLSHIYSLFIIVLGWVMFRAPGLKKSFIFYKILFSFNFKSTYLVTQQLINNQFVFVFIISILLCGPIQIIYKKIETKIKSEKTKKIIGIVENIALIILFLLCISDLSASGYNPFIYFRF